MTERSDTIMSPTFAGLRSVLNGGNDLFLCVPYFSQEGIQQVGLALKRGKKVEFWLPLNVTNWVSGHSDFYALATALKSVANRGADVRVRVKSTIHAKLYYARDKRSALITSANLTRAGFSSNVEIGLAVRGRACDQIDQWITQQEQHVPEIALDDLIDCIALTEDAVKRAATELDHPRAEMSADLNAAIELFEKELVPRLSRPQPTRPRRREPTEKIVMPGTSRISPRLGDIGKILPRGWPSYDEFLAFLKSVRSDDARELAERAEGKYNLQGHVKHFFWAGLMFLLENPRLVDGIDVDILADRAVRWDDIPWARDWKRFLDRHDDEYFEKIAVSFHTVKVYLPTTLGGISTTGGAGTGNFKRSIAYLVRYLREHK